MKQRTILVIIISLVAAIMIAYLAIHRGGASSLGDKRIETLVSGAPRSLIVETNMYSEGRVKIIYTCDSHGRPPKISIGNIPGGTEAIVLILYDPDAPKGAMAGRGTFIHWLLLERPGGAHAVVPAEGAIEGANSAGQIGYFPPCPPRGDRPHRYILVGIALDRWPSLAQGFTLSDLIEQARGHVVAWGMVAGTYSRN